MLRQPEGPKSTDPEKKSDGRWRRRVAVNGGGGLGGFLVVGGAMVAVAVGVGFLRSRVFGRKKEGDEGKRVKIVEEPKGSIESQDSLGGQSQSPTSSCELGFTPPPPESSSLGSSEDDSDGGTGSDHLEIVPPNPHLGIMEHDIDSLKGEEGQEEEEILVESNPSTPTVGFSVPPVVDEVAAEKEEQEQQEEDDEEEEEEDDEEGCDDDGTDTEDSSSMGSDEYTKWPAEGTDYSSSSSLSEQEEEEECGTKSSFDSEKEPPTTTTTTKNRTIVEQRNDQEGLERQGMGVVVAKNSKFLYLHLTLALVVMVVAFLLTDRLLRKALHLFGVSTSS